MSTITVKFAQSGTEATWDPKAENLLDFAEDQGLDPDFGCRAGNCLSCECKLVEGTTEYLHEIGEDPEEGSILICSARPTSDIVLDI